MQHTISLLIVPNISPGGVAILPTVLYLLTGVLRECGSKAHSMQATNTTPILTSVVLDALANIARHPYARDPRSKDQWCSLLQSALANIIDLSKTCELVLNCC